MDTISKIIEAVKNSPEPRSVIESIIKEEIMKDRKRMIQNIEEDHSYGFSEFLDSVEIQLSE